MKNESFAVYISIIRKYFVSYCTEKISNFGVTYTQLFVLIYIGKNNECSPKEIVEYLKIDAGQLNRILTKLLEKDLINQRKNNNDRRFNVLSLTESGKNIDENSIQELMNLMKKIIFKLNEIDGGKQNEQIKRFYEHIDR